MACARLRLGIGGVLLLVLFASCVTKDRQHRVVVSVADQAMDVYYRQHQVARYQISTSKFCLGDAPGSCGTPLGRLEIAKKIGAGAPLGTVFKDRKPTGEILKPDTPGRDPIVSRILWLKGLEPGNRNAYGRCIYIHGTPEERNIGRPASYGCIRMRSRDVAHLFRTVGVGAEVDVMPGPLPDPNLRRTPTPTAAAQASVALSRATDRIPER
ncbi:MAG: L,D-transpeptidase [Verrucomicrobia bacterium]|nr:L,D-transpeptidase [Verrucomicrobiota bacterium]